MSPARMSEPFYDKLKLRYPSMIEMIVMCYFLLPWIAKDLQTTKYATALVRLGNSLHILIM